MKARLSVKAMMDIDAIAEQIQEHSSRAAYRFIISAESMAEHLGMFSRVRVGL